MFCSRLLGIIFIGVILVRTLATVTNALTEELPVVRHECGEEPLCRIKPPDYPQEEIDEMAFKYLRHLPKTKREAVEELVPASPEEGGNCESVTLNSPVYTIRESNMTPQYVIQSKWFNQNVPHVQCKKEKSPCFSEFVIPGIVTDARCKTNRVSTSLLVFDLKSKKPVRADSLIDIACDCVFTVT